MSLRRTIRGPENKKSFELPPDLGTFPIYSVSDYKDQLPESLAAKGGVFLHQCEAIWIKFTCVEPFAVKFFTSRMNTASSQMTSLKGLENQDYVVPPYKCHLDGIARGGGFVRQFVATQRNLRYSVEEEPLAPIQCVLFRSRSFRTKGNSKAVRQAVSNLLMKTLADETIHLGAHPSGTFWDLKR